MAVMALATAMNAAEYLVYFGTFTGEKSKGIYVSRMDTDTGQLSEPELAAAVASPNFLAISPDGRFLFAAARSNAKEGFVDAYAIARPSGKLTQIYEASSGGAGPCFVSLDPTGRVLLVANYTGGSVKSLRVAPDGRMSDGSFIQHEGRSVNPDRQAGPHAHCFIPAPQGRFALACDLGMDKVMIYRLDPADGSLAAGDPAFATVASGSGPRHLVFSRDGKRVYVVSEMACTLSAFDWDASRGVLALRETVSLLPPGIEVAPTFSAAAIVVSPDGRFIYATVRGHDSVSVFESGSDGGLSLVENVPCGGEVPRGLGMDPTGRWLLVGNQKSDSVTVFQIDGTTGRLTATDHGVSVGAPVDVKFVK